MHKLCIATISPLAAILARSQCNYLVWEVSNLNLHVQEEYSFSRCFVQEQLSHLSSLPVQEHILRVWRGKYHSEGASWGLRSEYSQESGIKIEVWLFSKAELRKSFSNVIKQIFKPINWACLREFINLVELKCDQNVPNTNSYRLFS